MNLSEVCVCVRLLFLVIYNISTYGMYTYAIFSTPYYDTFEERYKNILTINKSPTGELVKLIRQIKFFQLSPFKSIKRVICGYGIYLNGTTLATVDDIPELFSFLTMNGYTIDTNLTKMMNDSDVRINDEYKLVAYIHF